MDNQTVLEGYSDAEKGAYLSAIASIATADREASEEELSYLTELSNAAELSGEQQAAVQAAATQVSGEDLQRSLDILKGSELKYSLIADLIAFGKSDSDYSDQEQQNVQQIGEYLGVNQQQFSLLNDFAETAATQQTTPDQPAAQGIFGMDGLQNKMQSAGINTGGLLKGLIAVAAPILISRFLKGRNSGSSSGGLGGMLGGGGGLGGMLGGSGGSGGLGGMLGGGGGGLGGMLGGGGLGSVIGMLNGGKGFGSAGGLLGKILGSKF